MKKEQLREKLGKYETRINMGDKLSKKEVKKAKAYEGALHTKDKQATADFFKFQKKLFAGKKQGTEISLSKQIELYSASKKSKKSGK